MPGESIEWRLAVRDDGSAVIDKARAKMDVAGDAASKLAQGFGKLDAAVQRNTPTLKGMQEGLGKSAGALAAMSAAMGQGESKLAKFGQAAVGLMGAFAVGGPFLAGLTAAGFAIEAYSKASKDAEAANNVWRKSVDEMASGIHLRTLSSLQPTREAIKAITDEVKNFGKTAHEIALEGAVAMQQQIESQIANIEKTARFRQASANVAEAGLESARMKGRGIDDAQDRFDLAQQVLTENRIKLDELRIAAGGAEDAVWKLAEGMAGLGAKKGAAKGSGGASAGDPLLAAFTGEGVEGLGGDLESSRAETYQRAAEARRSAEQAEIDGAVAKEQRLAAIEKGAAAERASQREIDNERRRASEERLHQDVAGYATQGAGIVAGASQQLIADLITGQEHAAERFGLSIMQQAGQALVSYGTQAIGRGILEASSPLTAVLAPASFGAGALLIGAGVGLGGAAAGLGSNLSASSSSSARTSPGTSTRAGSGSSGAASGAPSTTVINVTYGAAQGKVAEDVARETANAVRRDKRRGR